MNDIENGPVNGLVCGLEAAEDANHEFDVWQRAKSAAEQSEETTPEGISPDEVHQSFLDKVSIAGEFIGRGACAAMTESGLQIDEAAHWQITFPLSEGPKSPAQVRRPK